VGQLLLRQTFSNAVVRGLYSSPQAKPPASFPLSAVTLSVASADAVHKAYQSFEANRWAWRIKDLETVEANGEESSFLFSDLNGNWWEITSARA
jgi:hypothetical protein